LTSTNAALAGARIRRAERADAAALTRLALASKASWGYDAAFMEACRAELTLEARDIVGDPTFVIAPEAVRCGIGRRLWAHLERTARAVGVTHLEVDSDPHAEGFYRRTGMRRTGQAASGSIAERLLPHLIKDLAPASSNPATAARAAVNDP
jgi:GNAT superfamily N-acetyltransferase